MPEQKQAVERTFALVYLRVSTQEQEQTGVSLAFQRAACIEHLRTRGWEHGGEYLDVMRGDRDERPQYQALLAQIRRLRASNLAAAVIVARLDRLGRRLVEAVRCRQELKLLGVPLHSVREGGEVPDLVANILVSVAQDELRQRRERMLSVWRHVVADGWYAPGARPWGFKLRQASGAERAEGAPHLVLEIDGPEAELVRELFRRSARGESLRSIARWLDQLPADQTHGMALSAGTLSRALHNPVYVGRQRVGATDVLERRRGRWPAIIADSLWTAVQSRRQTPLWGRATGRYLLSSFLRCVRCGSRAGKGQSTNRGGAVYPFYHCSFRTYCEAYIGPQVVLDTALHNAVDKVLARFARVQRARPSAVAAAWLELQEERATRDRRNTQRRACRQAAIEKAQDRLTRAVALLAGGELDLTGYEMARDVIQGELDRAADHADEKVDEPVLESLGLALSQMESWQTALGGSNVSAQREVLAKLIGSVRVERPHYGQYTLQITWTVLGRGILMCPSRVAHQKGK